MASHTAVVHFRLVGLLCGTVTLIASLLSPANIYDGRLFYKQLTLLVIATFAWPKPHQPVAAKARPSVGWSSVFKGFLVQNNICLLALSSICPSFCLPRRYVSIYLSISFAVSVSFNFPLAQSRSMYVFVCCMRVHAFIVSDSDCLQVVSHRKCPVSCFCFALRLDLAVSMHTCVCSCIDASIQRREFSNMINICGPRLQNSAGR